MLGLTQTIVSHALPSFSVYSTAVWGSDDKKGVFVPPSMQGPLHPTVSMAQARELGTSRLNAIPLVDDFRGDFCFPGE